MEIKKANFSDLRKICGFTDFWLSGRGLRVQAPGAVNDCFISPSQHKKYIQKYTTTIIIHEQMIIGWAVVQLDGSLIHLLIAGTFRGLGLGKLFLNFLCPQKIHSKSNQSSGNPGPFYEHMGYHKTGSVKSKSRYDIDKIRPDRGKIIDIYQKTLLLQSGA